MKPRKLEAADAIRWDEFVRAHPDGTFFHLSGWGSVVQRAFGHTSHDLLVEQDGRIVAVLPLMRMRSRLFGDSLVSVPFGVYGGIVAENDEARRALRDAAESLARRLGVGVLELRNRARLNEDWPCKTLYVTFRRELDADPEVNLQRVPRKQRAMIRKGIKAGLTSEIDADIERFYPLYAESLRNLGTPVFSRRLFRSLREVFGEHCEVLTVLHEGRAVASVMSFYFRDEVLPFYGGGSSAARDLAANDFMYWELMRRAAERGVRIFDYGRSKCDTGSYSFKKHWGFEPAPLFYECLLVRAQELPAVHALNPRYATLIGMWKRLPLPLANLIGPLISKNLG